ncbi:hypothetical protein QJS66_09295 [Kocuria rhizophila]|nr:hypothetical protein QJS66_09295 [Kocuria rhizophila]
MISEEYRVSGEKQRSAIARASCPAVPADPGRGDVCCGHPHGAARAEGHGGSAGAAHVLRDRPPAVHHPGRGHDHRDAFRRSWSRVPTRSSSRPRARLRGGCARPVNEPEPGVGADATPDLRTGTAPSTRTRGSFRRLRRAGAAGVRGPIFGAGVPGRWRARPSASTVVVVVHPTDGCPRDEPPMSNAATSPRCCAGSALMPPRCARWRTRRPRRAPRHPRCAPGCGARDVRARASPLLGSHARSVDGTTAPSVGVPARGPRGASRCTPGRWSRWTSA